MYNIEVAKDFELDEIVSLDQILYQRSWSKNSFMNVMQGANTTYIIKKDNKIIGYAAFSCILDEATLERIGIAPEYQELGYGEKLLHYSIQILKERIIKKIFLEVNEKNIPAKRLYQKLAFKKIGIRPQYYNEDDAEVYLLEVSNNGEYSCD